MTPESEQTTLSTLERGLVVLDFIVENGPVNAKRIAKEVGIRQATCYHILRTLVLTGHVTRLDDGEYEPGPRAFATARQVQLRVSVAPELNVILTRLHNVTHGETTYISRWHDAAVILQNYLAGTQATNVTRLEVGFGGDLHARASSKAIISRLPGGQIESLFKGVPLAQLTAATITDYEELRVELAQVKRQGYAIDRGEFASGVHCVAASFVDAQGLPVGAYTVSVPSERFEPTKSHLISAVLEASGMATRFLSKRSTVAAATVHTGA
ncbi:IclR family transcriptional regulator C-terminal domain-containing protein [Microbacterium sp. QXD-8]|uniref:IclR family transcriptional regulator C-terminal domain-containing protein n=1 Tax=Microbacterium psychrotolerans TaxID=3068321 RepID=A0ABU0YXM5_9MICO|nr:IclR family transcriptional regulator C-terminal domain-containing protein [Microbacterium sp. QXD-8]MDQ7876513.1 IclR family transcriptional regulator C-terminal domain-containing protein [Microbacterium sp. QXD-8]